MEQIYSCDWLPGMEIPRKAFAWSTLRQVAVNPGVHGTRKHPALLTGDVRLN